MQNARPIWCNGAPDHLTPRPSGGYCPAYLNGTHRHTPGPAPRSHRPAERPGGPAPRTRGNPARFGPRARTAGADRRTQGRPRCRGDSAARGVVRMAIGLAMAPAAPVTAIRTVGTAGMPDGRTDAAADGERPAL